MRADWPVEDGVDAQFGEFTPDALPQGCCECCLLGGSVLEVDVDVKGAATAVVQGRWEGRVGTAFSCRGQID
jgi:hypothetical protein